MAGTNQIKISELPTKENTSTNDYLVMDDGSETSKIKAKDFMVQFTQPINKSIADLQNEIDELNRLIDCHVYGFKREIANSNYLTRITHTDEAFGKIPVTVNLTNQTQD